VSGFAGGYSGTVFVLALRSISSLRVDYNGRVLFEPHRDLTDHVRQVFERVNRDRLKIWVDETDPTFKDKLGFAVSRLQAGVDLKQKIYRDYPGKIESETTVLEVGGGNGGLLLPFALDNSLCISLDVFAHLELLDVVRETGLTVFMTTGVGENLPFDDEVFDAVIYAETIEHVRDAKLVGAEITRVLKPGGICAITSPPRLTYAFRPDPHYGVRGIVLLPNSWQRFIVERVARKGTLYEVTHLYWTVLEIMKTMPRLNLLRVYSSARWNFLKRFDWELIVALKPTHEYQVRSTK